MATDRELVEEIFGDSDEEEFAGFSREELGIIQMWRLRSMMKMIMMRLAERSMMKLLHKLSTKNGQEPLQQQIFHPFQ